MNPKSPCWPQDHRVLYVAACALLFGCTSSHKTFHFGAPELENGFNEWKRSVHLNDLAMIERLERDDTVIIHIINGQVSAQRTRGALSQHHRGDVAQRQCPLHPASSTVAVDSNWDVIYDHRAAAQIDREAGYHTPFSVILHHEVLGHIVPMLSMPSWAKEPRDVVETYAVQKENEYRQRLGLPLVPPPRLP
jgi:hypothetical protein